MKRTRDNRDGSGSLRSRGGFKEDERRFDEDRLQHSVLPAPLILRSSSSSQKGPETSVAPHFGQEIETESHRIDQREKQISKGKNTIGYSRYVEKVPPNRRSKEDPRTPPLQSPLSKRAWDGIYKQWRRQLHTWDTYDLNRDENGGEKKMDDDQREARPDSGFTKATVESSRIKTAISESMNQRVADAELADIERELLTLGEH
jgi:histone RNA hairpin-binding protein